MIAHGPLTDRTRDIVRRRRAGETYFDIGCHHGITGERVTQIYRTAIKWMSLDPSFSELLPMTAPEIEVARRLGWLK